MKAKTTTAMISIALGLVVLIAAVASSATPAPQSQQAKQIEALVDKGAALVASKGKAAFGEFRKRGSDWYKGDVYLFVNDFKGNVFVNPPTPKLEGDNITNLQDANGKFIFKTFTALLETKDSGWVDYVWPKPGTDKPVKKLSYIRKAKMPDGMSIIIGAGIYPE